MFFILKIIQKRLIALSLLPLMACSFGKADHESKWNVLDSVKSTKCERWPMKETDLDVDDITVFNGAKSFYFLSSGRKRSTEPVFYFTPYDGSVSFDSDDLQPLTF